VTEDCHVYYDSMVRPIQNQNSSVLLEKSVQGVRKSSQTLVGDSSNRPKHENLFDKGDARCKSYSVPPKVDPGQCGQKSVQKEKKGIQRYQSNSQLPKPAMREPRRITIDRKSLTPKT
jgi:hypothetical protein